MKVWTTFYDHVMPELPGAELALVLHQIKQTCLDFYDSTTVSREVLPVIDVVANTATYTIVPSDAANFAVDRVLEVRWFNGSKFLKLDPTNDSNANIDYPEWDTKTGTPTKFLQSTGPDKITLLYIPDTSLVGGLKVKIAKVPLYAGAGIDDDVYAAYSEALGYGIKGRMMRMAKKPWSNPTQAKMYLDLYATESAAAAVFADKGYGKAPFRTRAYA
jgi:hypothetical protein